MKPRHIGAIAVVAASVVVGMTFAAEDRSTLDAPNGIALSEFNGYEACRVGTATIASQSAAKPRSHLRSHQCHSLVKARDHVFTSDPQR